MSGNGMGELTVEAYNVFLGTIQGLLIEVITGSTGFAITTCGIRSVAG